MDEILTQLADAGGPAFLLALAFRFWSQFKELLAFASRSATWAAGQLETFVDRTSVIMARKIWWVILPVMLVMTVASSISAWNIPGNGWWFSLNLVLKLLAFVACGWMAFENGRVKHIPDGHGLTSQKAINKAYGRPGLFVPMFMTAFYALVTLTGAMLSDTFMLADDVWWVHSLFSAILFVMMLFFTLTFVGAQLVAVGLIAREGIEFTAGMLWSNVVVPVATALLVGLTRNNNAGLKSAPAERAKLKKAVWDLLANGWFLIGLVMAWVMFFMSFHSAIGWVLELAWIIVLVSCMLTYVLVIKKPMLYMAEIIVITVCAAGLIVFLLRSIDSGVPPQTGEAHHVVMFYYRFWRALLWVGGCFTWFSDNVLDFTPMFVAVFLAIAGGAVWFAKQTFGMPARLLYTVAVICAVMGLGMVLARSAFADEPSTTPAVSTASGGCGTSLVGITPRQTVNAGSHSASNCVMTPDGSHCLPN